jgi:hypothetical protein
MKIYIVFLLAIVLLLTLQSSDTQAGGFVRGGFAPRGFAAPSGRRFASRPVIVINPASQVVRFSPFAHRFVIARRRFVGNTVIIREPFFCFGHGIGFINEPLFFDHLHRFHGIPFEAIPGVVVHSGSQVFFFGH